MRYGNRTHSLGSDCAKLVKHPHTVQVVGETTKKTHMSQAYTDLCSRSSCSAVEMTCISRTANQSQFPASYCAQLATSTHWPSRGRNSQKTHMSQAYTDLWSGSPCSPVKMTCRCGTSNQSQFQCSDCAKSQSSHPSHTRVEPELIPPHL